MSNVPELSLAARLLYERVSNMADLTHYDLDGERACVQSDPSTNPYHYTIVSPQCGRVVLIEKRPDGTLGWEVHIPMVEYETKHADEFEEKMRRKYGAKLRLIG